MSLQSFFLTLGLLGSILAGAMYAVAANRFLASRPKDRRYFRQGPFFPGPRFDSGLPREVVYAYLRAVGFWAILIAAMLAVALIAALLPR